MHAFFHVAVAQVFSPGIIAHVDLSGGIEGIDSGLAVSAHHNRTQVAGPDPVHGHQIHQRVAKLFQAVINLNAIDLGRIYQPLHVLCEAKNCRSLGPGIATDALKH